MKNLNKFFKSLAKELVKDGRVMTFSMPMITGYSVSNGFEFNLQDKTGGRARIHRYRGSDRAIRY